MIRFSCEQCGFKISVQDANAGKKGKCPKCKNVLFVPAKHDIDFDFSGKPGEIKLQNKQDNTPKTTEDTSEYYHYPSEYQSKPEYDGKRKYPWFIDIFLYTTSKSGLVNLAIFTAIFTIVYLLRTNLSTIGRLISMPLAIIGLYMGWYFTECVRDSAKGGTRAPEAFAYMGLGEMWEQVQHIVGVYLVYPAPVLFYQIFTNRLDTIFWILLITGTFFFPMALLSCIMFDSARGLNPILLLVSIFSTFFQYCGLVLLVIMIILSFIFMIEISGANNMAKFSISILILSGILFFLQMYISLVIAHLIGRFYWRNEEKLNWEC